MFGYRYSHERMRRSDRQYDLVIPTDYNWPIAVPGLGSAIFLHIWKRPRHPTAGCVAFAREDLVWIAERLTDRTRLVVRPDDTTGRIAGTRRRHQAEFHGGTFGRGTGQFFGEVPQPLLQLSTQGPGSRLASPVPGVW